MSSNTLVLIACLAVADQVNGLQRVFALQALLGVLQQLAQVQQVAQTPFTIGLGQHALRHVLAVQPLVQHGQHTVLLPLAVPLVELFKQLFPLRLVLRDAQKINETALKTEGIGAVVRLPNETCHLLAMPLPVRTSPPAEVLDAVHIIIGEHLLA